MLFWHRIAENQYMSHRKYGVHLGLVFGSQNALAFGLYWLTYDSYCKLHTRSKKAHLGPRYTIYYFTNRIGFFSHAKYHQLAVFVQGRCKMAFIRLGKVKLAFLRMGERKLVFFVTQSFLGVSSP